MNTLLNSLSAGFNYYIENFFTYFFKYSNGFTFQKIFYLFVGTIFFIKVVQIISLLLIKKGVKL